MAPTLSSPVPPGHEITPGRYAVTIGPVAPGYSQDLFLRSRARFKAFSGPVGSGKTMALCMAGLAAAVANPGCAGMITAPSLPMLDRVTARTWFDVLQASEVRFEASGGNSRRVKIYYRSSLGDCLESEVFLTSASNPDSLRGPNLAWFAMDELTYTPWASFEQLQSRLRDKRAHRLQGMAAFTPKGFDEAHNFFLDEPRLGVTRRGEKIPVEERDLIQAVPYENAGNQYTGYYQSLRRSMSLAQYRQEVLGEFLNFFADQAYWAFSRLDFPDGNIGERGLDPALPLYWVLDFNVNPMCSLVVQARPAAPPAFHGGPSTPLEVRVLDEIVLASSSIQEAVDEFCGRYGSWLKSHNKSVRTPQGSPLAGRPPGPWPPGLVLYGDATGRARARQSHETDWQWVEDCLARHNLYPTMNVPSSNPPVRDRVQSLNAMLCNANGERAIVIHPKCRALIRDLEQVGWKRGSRGQVIDNSDPELTHTSSALGYLCVRDNPMYGSIGPRGDGRII